MNKLKILIIFLGFLFPYLLIYKSFLGGGHLAWGDAPFFYPENLTELFSLPFLWNFKNENLGAPQFNILWLYLPTYLYGLLNHYLGIGNDLLVRIIFYFPATILAIAGSWLFIGNFTKDNASRFLGSFLYGFNTYFLTLIDGGQVGVALSYGLFPLTVALVVNFLNKAGIRNYFLAFLSLFAVTNIDLRIAIIAVMLTILLQIRRRDIKKRTVNFLLILFSVATLSSYWIVPFILNYRNVVAGIEGISGDNNFINLINSLFLYQPHFPLNEFGKLAQTPFYFALLPVLVLGGLALPKTKNKCHYFLALVFLILVFLAKGGSEPFGGIYSYLVDKLPFGIAFRDSSKFFIPLLLVGGTLLALTVVELERLFKNKILWIAAPIYLYLLLLIHPALLGGLTGVLGNGTQNNNFSQIYATLQKDAGFYRTLWFEEKPPLGFADWKRPTLSANTLYLERPFASQINGQYDLFQYVRSPQIDKWWNLLGIKYIFLSGNERRKVVTPEDTKSQMERLQFIESNVGLKKIPLSSFPAFEVSNPKPHIFAQKKIFLVVGGEEIYNYLFTSGQFDLANNALVFLEDGKINLESLLNIDPGDADLVFVNKSQQDLMMGSLIKLFNAPSNASLNEWQLRGSGEYLKWKYDLLKQDISSFEFDFGKGMAFSTIDGEKLGFDIDVPEDGNYFLVIRHLGAKDSNGLKITYPGQEKIIPGRGEQNFHWEIIGTQLFKKGPANIMVQNLGGFNMLNTIAVIPESDFNEAAALSAQIMSRFPIIQISNGKDLGNLTRPFDKNFVTVEYSILNPTQYNISNLPPEAKWLVFSDHYNEGWQLSGNNNNLHLPFYEMINGFYLKDVAPDVDVIFAPQKNIGKGILASLFAFIAIIGISVALIIRNRRK